MNLGYEVLIQPALFVLLGAYTIYSLLRGFSRGKVLRDGHEISTLHFDASVVKTAGIKLVGGLLVLAGLVVTPPGHRGVIYSAVGGVSDNARPVGMSFIIPLAQSAVMMDVRSQAFSTIGEDGKANGFIQTQDLQEVTVRATVRYHVDPNQAAILFNTVGKDYAPILIRPALYDAVKEAGGQVKAEDFAQNLQLLDAQMRAIIESELAEHGILIESVLIEDAIFDPLFVEQIKANEIARQKEKGESFHLISVAENEAEAVIARAAGARAARILEAEGERAAIEEIASALGFTPQQYIEWLTRLRWDGAVPRFVGSDSGFIFDLGGAQE